MSAQSTDETPRETLTIDDVKVRAERVRDLAKQEASQAVRNVAAQPLTQMLAIAGVVVGVGLSLAYFFGTRSGARRVMRRPPAPPA